MLVLLFFLLCIFSLFLKKIKSFYFLKFLDIKGFMFNLVEVFCILKNILRNLSFLIFEDGLIKFFRNR